MNSQQIAATVFWGLALGFPLITSIVQIFRPPLKPLQWLFYGVDLILVRLMWRADLPRRLPIPPDQGAVIICNHRSSIDTCFIQAVAGPRLIHWMVAQLYGRGTFIAWFLDTCEMIPVRRRGNNTSPARAAILLAEQQKLVGMLPEGAINRSDDFMRSVRPGAVHVALKAGVPILPCYIEGAPYHDTVWRPLFMTARARVKIGRPIDLSEYHGREQDVELVRRLTVRCVKEIARLAGQPDFEPKLAGVDWKTWQDL